jgi:hypothetical protein
VYLNEADVLCLLSKASSAQQHIVFSDKAYLTLADSAGAGVLAVVAWMRFPEFVGHDWMIEKYQNFVCC